MSQMGGLGGFESRLRWRQEDAKIEINFEFTFKLNNGTYKQWIYDVAFGHSEPASGKRIFSEMDPYGEEWREDDF